VKKLALLGFLLLAFATCAVADEITFSYIIGDPGSLTATAAAGLMSGPAMNVLVSDATTGVEFALAGTFNDSTGPGTLTNFGTFVVGAFTAGGTNSVTIVDPSMNPLVTGNMMNNSAFLAQFPLGTGAFLGSFQVTFVDPAVLALFGLGPAFKTVGSVSSTFADVTFDGTTISGTLGGGTVTIQTPTVVPEPAGLGLLGMGLLTTAGVLRRRRA
jgi:hypothetical protein